MCVKATIYRNAVGDAFRFILIPFVIFFYFTGCETERGTVIDPSYDTPFILNLTISPEEINTDTILVNGDAHPADSITLVWDLSADIETRGAENLTLYYRIKDNASSLLLTEGVIEGLDHSSPIIAVNDIIAARIARSNVGQFSITVNVETATGLHSNVMNRSVNIFRTNQPPEIINVEAPSVIDTQEIGEGAAITMTAFVDDPDGADDVIRVQTTNVQPDGQRVGPFELDKEEPGTFSIPFTITPDAKKGIHRFEFKAFDRMNEESELYVHELEIQ